MPIDNQNTPATLRAQTSALMVMRETLRLLDIDRQRTGWTISRLVGEARSGRRTLTVQRPGHDYTPFQTRHAATPISVTVQLPDLRQWDKAIDTLGLGVSRE